VALEAEIRCRLPREADAAFASVPESASSAARPTTRGPIRRLVVVMWVIGGVSLGLRWLGVIAAQACEGDSPVHQRRDALA
jgi:hypothetical protein